MNVFEPKASISDTVGSTQIKQDFLALDNSVQQVFEVRTYRENVFLYSRKIQQLFSRIQTHRLTKMKK